MLYGNIIFIKKTGGDGSKCPVTERSIKIGRSEECLIRIYNNKVALEHCQLIIGDDGQAILKDLSNQTVLNGNVSVHGEITLCHGDIFKVGERLARWEYLPTSKYYRQPLPSSSPVRLVAVVVPQKRSSDGQSTPENSASFTGVTDNTCAEGKSRYSERFAAENNSSVKMRKSSDSGKSKDMLKLLMGCHSFKTTKLILPGTKIKKRKSTLGIIHPKIAKEKSRKSTLPSWKVNIVTPPSTSTGSSSSKKSQKKSNKSPQNTVSFKKALELESENLSDAKNTKASKKIVVPPEEIISKLKSELKLVGGSPLKNGKSNQRFSSYSPSKSPPRVSTPSQLVRLVHSEKKQKPSSVKSSGSKEFKRLSLVLNKADKKKLSFNKGLSKNFASPDLNSSKEGKFVNDSTSTPGKLKKTPRKSSIKKVVNTYEHSTPKKSVTKNGVALKNLQTPAAKDQISLIELDLADSKQQRKSSSVKKKTVSLASTPLSKTPSSRKKSISKLKSSSSRKLLDSTISSQSSSDGGKSHSSASPSVQVTTHARNSKLPAVESTKKADLLKERTSPRGVRRGLSPSISTAERAAKKLKTCSPKKPDKNKKAALLVLGKANRKQFLSKNVKVLLKQKILKKAIKQSTVGNVQKNENLKGASKSKPKKGSQAATFEPKIKRKGKGVSSKSNTPKNFLNSVEVSLQGKGVGEGTPVGNIIKEENLNNSMFVEASAQSLKYSSVFNETKEKSPSNQLKKTESSRSSLFKTPAEEIISLYGSYEKTAENFFLNSNRRCSKRLSSKNDTGRPDFMELSPTALGLIPKNLEVFKTPNQNRRRSSSLETSKISQSLGIIKSASTSKIGNRKSVRFSSKDMSINSGFFSPTLCEKTDVDLGNYQTPNVSVDAFISPLEVKSDTAKKRLCESSRETFSSDNSSKLTVVKTNEDSKPKKCVRKLLQSPKRESLRGSRASIKSPNSGKAQQKPAEMAKNAEKDLSIVKNDLNCHKTPIMQKNLKSSSSNDKKNSLEDFTGIKKLLRTPKVQKGPKNELSDLSGVKKLLRTPKVQKSPKNELSDLRGVKKLLRTPKVQKSPKNELSDLRGVRKLLRTPKVQKSPKNELSDLRGVKKLLRTPKVQKSPKNELSDLRGVRKLLRTPKVQKSPKNELSDLTGVKKLLRTPKVQKSPKNELSDLRGVRKLLGTPKVQKSPKNDLSDLRGVKKLLRTPKVQKSPKNELSDLRGVKKLLRTPKVQKSPKNELSDLRGVKKLLGTPKVQKSPKNDLSDLRGVKKLLGTPKIQKSPKNDLTDVAGVKELLHSPKNELSNQNEIQQSVRSPKLRSSLRNTPSKAEETTNENFVEAPKSRNSKGNSAKDFKELSKSFELRKNCANDILNVTEVMDLPVGKRRKLAPQNSRVNDFRGSRGRRAIYSSEKDPKNDLSDVSGVPELFSRHEPNNDYSIDLTGVSQLFDSPKVEVVSKPKSKRITKKSMVGIQEISLALRSENEISTRSRSRKESTTQETTRKRSARVKSKAEDKDEVKPSENELKTQKATKRTRSVQPVKSPLVVKQSTGLTKLIKKSAKGLRSGTKAEPEDSVEIQNTRKRKASTVNIAPSPPKLRKKQSTNEKLTSSETETTSKVRSRSKTAVKSGKPSSKKVEKVSGKVKDKVSKGPSSKVQNKRSQSIVKKNMSNSEEEVSPIKTRSTRGKATQKSVETKTTIAKNKTSKSTVGRRKVPSVTKKSTRRK